MSLTVVDQNGVCMIRFSRPEIRNPLSTPVIERLNEIVSKIKNRTDIEGLIFTGTADIFASGADLREITKLDPVSAREFALYGQTLMNDIAALPIPTFAAINGYCFGGALDLALACRHRIASPNATFSHPGAGLGIITGWGGTQRLPRLVGSGNALEMIFTASPIDAKRAFAIGLVEKIADDPLATALKSELTIRV